MIGVVSVSLGYASLVAVTGWIGIVAIAAHVTIMAAATCYRKSR